MCLPLVQPPWRVWNSRSFRVAWLGLLAISHILARAPVAAEPSPSPHRFIPAKDLVAYLEYEGLDAHSGAWKASAAHGILVEGHAGSMMSELARQLLDRFFKDDPDWKNRGADILAIHDHLLHRGFVIAVHDMGKDGLATTVVLRDVGARPVRDRLAQLVKLALGPQGTQKPPASLRFRGRDVFELEDEPETKPAVNHNAADPAVPPVPQAAATAANVTSVPVSPSLAEVAPASYMPPVVAPAPAVAVAQVTFAPPAVALAPATSAPPAVALAPAVAVAPATSAPPAVAPSSPDSPLPTPLSPSVPPVPPGESPPANALATSVPTSVSWWLEGNDLVLVEAPAADPKSGAEPAAKKKPDPASNKYRSLVIDTIEGKEPDITTNAAYVSAIAENNDIKGFEPNGLLIFDPDKGKSLLSSLIRVNETPALTLPSAKYISPEDAPPQVELSDSPAAELPELPDNPFAPQVDSGVKLAGNTAPVKVEDKGKGLDLIGLVGMDGLKGIVVRWGFQGKALLTSVRIEAPAPRKGLIACLAQPSFARSRLPAIPRDAREFVVGSFDSFGSYTKFKDMVKAIDPDLVKEILEAERLVCEAIGLRGGEALRQVGPFWSVFRLPSLDGIPPAAEPDLTEYAFVAGIDNAEALGKVLDSIAQQVNQQLAEAEKGASPDKDKKSADPPVLALEKLKAPDRGYQLTSPARLVPWLSDDLKPTILIGKSIVAVASNMERAREALSAEMPAGSSWSAHGELQKALECLPQNLTFLAVGDPRNSAWPTAFEQLPGEVQMLAGLLGFSEGEPSVGGGFLAALGIPRPGGFRVRIDPAQIPKAEQVRRNLFPSVLATTVDDRGFRLVSREAFPLACVGGKATFQSTGKLTSSRGLLQDVKLKLDLLGLGIGQ